jgi:hypothetical protein
MVYNGVHIICITIEIPGTRVPAQSHVRRIRILGSQKLPLKHNFYPGTGKHIVQFQHVRYEVTNTVHLLVLMSVYRVHHFPQLHPHGDSPQYPLMMKNSFFSFSMHHEFHFHNCRTGEKVFGTQVPGNQNSFFTIPIPVQGTFLKKSCPTPNILPSAQ